MDDKKDDENDAADVDDDAVTPGTAGAPSYLNDIWELDVGRLSYSHTISSDKHNVVIPEGGQVSRWVASES